ncbi:MAG: c-type cytochrome biogenesis protein CcmI [Betaproteobacteria bacterium]|nr:c-type cytochrome biogenesis protein CcmI [Betaproteobacteria bacterium]
MTGFALTALLMACAALLFVLPPLLRRHTGLGGEDRVAANAVLYRDQLAELEREHAVGAIGETDYRDAKLELERRLLADVTAAEPDSAAIAAPKSSRGLGIAIGILVPAIALSGYLLLGNPGALDPAVRANPEARHAVSPEQIKAMAAKLAARLEQAPDDAEGWAMLARSYAVMGDFAGAVKAYSQVSKLVPGNAGLLADYADALAMTRGRKLAGEPYELLKRALVADPKHIKSLALAGTAEFEARNYAGAVALWERILQQAESGSEFGRSVQASIDEARELGKLPAPLAKAPAATPAAGPSITGTVKLSPALAKQVGPGDALFVYARAAEGSRMPVAIIKTTADGVPYRFVLDDSHSMSPAAKLSGQTKVIVEARISKSGTAKAQKGDLSGTSAAVAPGVKELEILIDKALE